MRRRWLPLTACGANGVAVDASEDVGNCSERGGLGCARLIGTALSTCFRQWQLADGVAGMGDSIARPAAPRLLILRVLDLQFEHFFPSRERHPEIGLAHKFQHAMDR